MNKKIFLALLILTVLLVTPLLAVRAQEVPDGGGTSASASKTEIPDGGGTSASASKTTKTDSLPNIDTPDKVIKVIDNITNWMFTIFIAVAIIFILIAAFQYLLARGNAEEVMHTHKMLMYSAVAITVALLARGVIHVVEKIATP